MQRQFCAPPNIHPLFGVLGVFTAEENVARRAAARTWLSGTSHHDDRSMAGMLLARFVARGIGVTPILAREAQVDGDVIFLRGRADMPRANGPLLTLILWLRCALHAWPRATLIGKADDDVWVHVGATVAHLQGSLGALRSVLRVADNETPRMYWGLMETYAWSLTSHRPMGFSYKYGKGVRECRVQNVSNHSLLGPVHFAKGPMYFISSSLVSQIVADPEVKTYAMTVIASANHSRREKALPWEDVYTGVALTRAVAAESAAYVHMGSRVISEAYGIYAKQGFSDNTILFHANTAGARRMDRYSAMHGWAHSHHCDSGLPHHTTLRCEIPDMVSCKGTVWKRCLYVHNYSACPQSGPRWYPPGHPKAAASNGSESPSHGIHHVQRLPITSVGGRAPIAQ